MLKRVCSNVVFINSINGTKPLSVIENMPRFGELSSSSADESIKHFMETSSQF